MIFNLFSDKKYLINGEQLGADDFVQDSTVIEGAEQADEMVLPAEDYGIFSFFFLQKRDRFVTLLFICDIFTPTWFFVQLV